MFVPFLILGLILMFVVLPLTLWLGAKSEAAFYKKQYVELARKNENVDKTNDFLWRKLSQHERAKREYVERAGEIQRQALRISELQAENSRLKIAAGLAARPIPSTELN